jgi:hypothetical protein
MAVLAIFTGTITKSQYESLRKEANWERDNPAGGVFHAVGFDEVGGIHVADVWESPEAMNAFVGQRLMPAFKKLGISPPDVSVFPAHNVNAYKSIDKYRV